MTPQPTPDPSTRIGVGAKMYRSQSPKMLVDPNDPTWPPLDYIDPATGKPYWIEVKWRDISGVPTQVAVQI